MGGGGCKQPVSQFRELQTSLGGGCKCTRSHVSRLGMPRRRAVPPRSPNSAISLVRGCGVSARAHACVALAGPGGLGRCVAFGRPMMSVWGRAASRGRTPKGPKVACISFLRPFFWYFVFDHCFLFQLRLTCASHSQDAPDAHGSQHRRTAGASARSRSRSVARGNITPAAHHIPTTPAVGVAGCDEMAITPTMDSQLDATPSQRTALLPSVNTNTQLLSTRSLGLLNFANEVGLSQHTG